MQHGRNIYELTWKIPELPTALNAVGVRTRSDFVTWSGWAKSTVYECFPNDDWSGVATYQALCELSVRLRVELSHLASARKCEPMFERKPPVCQCGDLR